MYLACGRYIERSRVLVRVDLQTHSVTSQRLLFLHHLIIPTVKTEARLFHEQLFCDV